MKIETYDVASPNRRREVYPVDMPDDALVRIIITTRDGTVLEILDNWPTQSGLVLRQPDGASLAVRPEIHNRVAVTHEERR